MAMQESIDEKIGEKIIGKAMKKLDQSGLIPLLTCILIVVVVLIYFVFTRVQGAR